MRFQDVTSALWILNLLTFSAKNFEKNNFLLIDRENFSRRLFVVAG